MNVIVCAQRSQEEAGQQDTGSYSTGIPGKFLGKCGGLNRRVRGKGTSRSVNFSDDAFHYQRGSAVTQEEREDDDASQSDVDDLKSGLDEQCEATTTKTAAIQGESEDNISQDKGTPNVTDSTTAVQQTTTKCSGRTPRALQHFGDCVTRKEMENLTLHCDALISSGLQAIQQTPWRISIGKQRWTELKSLEQNNVWELVTPPSGQGIISGKWPFSHKLDDEENVVKYKARFVARGITQTPGIDFHDTYSLTTKQSTLKTILESG